MNDETSGRSGLPLLQPGQAQKEMTHNEALALLDLMVGARVLDAGSNDPPASPDIGDCWIVGAAPTGNWADHAHAIAGWTAGGWRFVAPFDGLTAWVDAKAVSARFVSGAWRVGDLSAARVLIDGVQVVGAQTAGIDDVSGGATIDAECRAGINAVIAALRAHGLIAS